MQENKILRIAVFAFTWGLGLLLTYLCTVYTDSFSDSLIKGYIVTSAIVMPFFYNNAD